MGGNKKTESQDELMAQIEDRAQEIHTDAYPMSIGELMSIYKEKELDIHPEFQRFFRWSDLQKSKFIESILLGIPIPSIFVSQREDGVWDVVDGVQRLSTIFEFVGILRDENGRLKPKSGLIATDYLPALQGIQWEKKGGARQRFPNALRLDFKRQKLDLKIIKKESDENTKYDLFERLNTLGAHLSDQEVRNCLLVMINRDFHNWLSDMAESKAFKETIALTDRAIEQRYDMELALRFIVFGTLPEDELRSVRDLGEFLTNKMKMIARPGEFDLNKMGKVFKKTFTILQKAMGLECFRRRDGKTRGRGGFLISVFEVLALGLGHKLWSDEKVKVSERKIVKAADNLWKDRTFLKFSGSGVRASSRIPKLVPLGRQLI